MALTKKSQRDWLNLTREEPIDPEREIIDPTITFGVRVGFPLMSSRIYGRTLSLVIK